MKIIMKGEAVAPFDMTLRGKDGAEIDVSLTLSPIRNSAGEIVAASAIARYIRERKRAEEARRESEESLRESQRVAGLGSYVLDTRSGRWRSSRPSSRALQEAPPRCKYSFPAAVRLSVGAQSF
jgi:PAS domain-containing protein